MSESSGQWAELGDADDLKKETPREVAIQGHLIALFYVDRKWYALDGLCAHQGGPIANGELSQGDHGVCVTCPWHGWQYELATGIQTVNRQPLQRTFETRERGGRLEIFLGGDPDPGE